MLVGSGRVVKVMGRGSNAAGNSYHDRTFEFLQELCICYAGCIIKDS